MFWLSMEREGENKSRGHAEIGIGCVTHVVVVGDMHHVTCSGYAGEHSVWWCVVLAGYHAAAKTILLLEKLVLAGSGLHLCRNMPP